MKRIYLLPNLITAFGLACGLFIIFKIGLAAPGEVDFDLLQGASMLLLLAALADVCDGAIARILKAESEFGVHFDTLADCVTFGVAPSVIVLKSLNFPADSSLIFFGTVAAMIYSLCGVLRLVRFNVKAALAKEDKELRLESKKNFTGLPIPAAALSTVSATLVLMLAFAKWPHIITEEVRAIGMIAIMTIIGYFMVSRWKFPSVKTLHFRVHSIYLVFITAFLAFVFLYGILHHFAIILFSSIWLYLILAWVLSITRVIAGRKNKTLVDFEPEPDDVEDL